MRLWDVVLGDADNVLEGHTDEVTDVIQISDGRLASCSADKSLRIWNVPRTKVRENVKGRTVQPPSDPPPADLLRAARAKH